MPSDRGHRYNAVPIPSYDEAMADGAAGPYDRNETESQSLLFSADGGAPSSSRRPNGYRPPTVESDDDSLFASSSDDDDDETGHVRREMQELEIGEPEHGSRSIWGKRIPFSLSLPSLPQWKWNWRWRLPRLRPTIQLPSGPSGSADADQENTTESTPRWRCAWPRINTEGVSPRQIALVIARVMAVVIVLSFLYLVFVSDVFDAMARRLGTGLRFNPDDVRRWVQANIEDKGMRASVKIFDDYAHLAGTEGDFALAMDMETMFHKAGLDSVHVDEYFAYLNYPKKDGRAVEILGEDGKSTWKAKLEETDPGTETEGRQTFAFHAHSKSGDVKGPLIYANYGSQKDFKHLRDQGIETKGAIALVRYYGFPEDPALKVKAAEEAGFAGCLIYSDPEDDGFRQGEVAPNGRFMPKDGVHRSSVSLANWIVGDVLTPGWPSTDTLPRVEVDKSYGLNKIPSLPLSWRDAKVLLENLKGKGQQAPKSWVGGVSDVEWWTGDDSSPVVRLKNDQDEVEKQSVWNVYGKIEGIEQSQKSVIIGNPRDALAFGATGPHSGTAVMVEVARVLGVLLSKGWRPLRSIEFMSWDGSDYNMIGSTEYVEGNLAGLRRDAYAYINIDAAVSGTEFHASGSPVFRDVLHRVLSHIEDPVQNTTLRKLWDERGAELENLVGTGGDWVPFQDIAGINSIEIEFRGDRYPKHSSYNNLGWVEKVGDPGFIYHTLMTHVVALLILELADRPVLPLSMSPYAEKMDMWVDDLNDWLQDKIDAAGKTEELKTLNADPIKIAINEIKSAAKKSDEWEATWESIVMSSGGWETNNMNSQRLGYNNQRAWFNTLLVEEDETMGIPNRNQYKHAVYGPDAWPTEKETFFPAVRAHAEAGDWKMVKETISRTAKWMRDAANLLRADSGDMIESREPRTES